MLVKKVDSDIKLLGEFLEFWQKLHDICNSITAKGSITKEDEGKFLDAKQIIREKYRQLRASFDVSYMPRGRMTDPVAEIVELKGVRFMSEKNLKKFEDDWDDSYVFLNTIQERLKERRRRLERFNPLGVFIKRFFERR